ncbi:hypothetical protein C5167_002115 [Papaver somniferum]|uniref:Uncharacterized protein n=1 Tax=Papaver somniferum TaxID=3469 RepID=A0A4Y7KZU9_PAPSO|nr:hypothetical protein C5167_002115 [Papaver somniferum]
MGAKSGFEWFWLWFEKDKEFSGTNEEKTEMRNLKNEIETKNWFDYGENGCETDVVAGRANAADGNDCCAVDLVDHGGVLAKQIRTEG